MGEKPAAKEASGGGGGRRGGGRVKKQIVENKVEDIQDYMEAAAALIHQYVPPQARAGAEGEGCRQDGHEPG